MNKHMYIGLVFGLIVSIILIKVYPFKDKTLVTVICTVIGTFAGAAVDKAIRKSEESDDEEWFFKMQFILFFFSIVYKNKYSR